MSTLHSAVRQMRPARFVEARPVAAMHEDDEALRRALGQKQIETVAGTRAIDEVEPGASLAATLAIGPRPSRSRRSATPRPSLCWRRWRSVFPIRYMAVNHAEVPHRSSRPDNARRGGAAGLRTSRQIFFFFFFWGGFFFFLRRNPRRARADRHPHPQLGHPRRADRSLISERRDRWHPSSRSEHRMRPIAAAAERLALIPIAREVFWGPMAYAMMGGIIVGTSAHVDLFAGALRDLVPNNSPRSKRPIGREREPVR